MTSLMLPQGVMGGQSMSMSFSSKDLKVQSPETSRKIMMMDHVEAKVDYQPTTPGGSIGELKCGAKVLLDQERFGVVRYIGNVVDDLGKASPEILYGIELLKSMGKHDGSVKGKRYFYCAAG